MNTDAVKMLQGRYCNSLTEYSRFVTREVNIGDVPMGGNNPIRIQSMTTTDTMDTIGTVEQSIRMVDAGCEYVRITAPSIKEANNLAEIKKQLRARGYTVPLVADIHFTPNAAEVAARIVEKVRVNPGNYADKKKFDQIDYTDLEYQGELERIFQKFTPLVKICKEYGTAMRIGTNHGSLSDRIMSRYGDTPQGMVESAMEFMRMCETLNYYNLVVIYEIEQSAGNGTSLPPAGRNHGCRRHELSATPGRNRSRRRRRRPHKIRRRHWHFIGRWPWRYRPRIAHRRTRSRSTGGHCAGEAICCEGKVKGKRSKGETSSENNLLPLTFNPSPSLL
jgi:hypothetical protein